MSRQANLLAWAFLISTNFIVFFIKADFYLV
ncbi:hypothetical protein J2T14_000255 [Paenibacillus harenae]|nr:hypothetical protein [Paenibacillus harenae]